MTAWSGGERKEVGERGWKRCMKRGEQDCMEQTDVPLHVWTKAFDHHTYSNYQATDLDVIINCELGKVSGKKWATILSLHTHPY